MIVWPPLITPRSIKFWIDARSQTGGASQTGVEQTRASSGGLWRATLGSIPIMTREKRNIWRALEAQIQGRTNEVIVPVFSLDQPEVDGLTYIKGIPHSDGSFFSNGAGYAQGVISAAFTSAAALRATQITIAIGGGSIEPGQYFSAPTGRLYRIASIVSTSGNDVTLNVWPPFREAVDAGISANFHWPTCKMKLASDDAMAAEFDLGRFASPSVEFIEAL
jgi:hypothetical protein